MSAPHTSVDVAIIGGGMIGLTTAVALDRFGISTCVIDRLDPAAATDKSFDGRVSSIAHASKNLFSAAGLWPSLAAHSAPILDIRVSDGPSRLFLHFAHEDVGDAPFGYMIENRHIRRALIDAAMSAADIEFHAPAAIAEIDRDANRVTLTLENGRRISAALLIGADGRNSRVREEASIPIYEWHYDQTGIVTTIEHEVPHHGVAQERFLAAGPFAVLPMTGNRSSLVWTESPAAAHAAVALGDAAFTAEIRRRVGDHLGELCAVGPRWTYPLALHHAHRYTDTRLALIGDAAHGVHPIAGQGLNMGLRDVAALVEILVKARRLGLDIGAATILDDYARWRRVDNTTLIAVTDSLNRLFSNDIGPVRLARSLGLGIVNRIPPLKRFFIEHARGTFGKLPRLLTGDPI